MLVIYTMSLVVGQRVADKDDFRGTVRYVGPVATSKTAGAVYAGERHHSTVCLRSQANNQWFMWRWRTGRANGLVPCKTNIVYVYLLGILMRVRLNPLLFTSNRSILPPLAGVEWDDKTRGKNDGAVVVAESGQEVRYFTCSPGAGSFMKLDLLSAGVSILDALDER